MAEAALKQGAGTELFLLGRQTTCSRRTYRDLIISRAAIMVTLMLVDDLQGIRLKVHLKLDNWLTRIDTLSGCAEGVLL